MEANEHAVLTQSEIDKLIQHLSQVSERSYQEGLAAAGEAADAAKTVSSGSSDYDTGYNQGVKIGYERGVSDAWDIIKKLLNQGSEELDVLLRQSSLDITKK